MQSSACGILGEQAPNWRVSTSTWFNLAPGRETVDLSDFAGKLVADSFGLKILAGHDPGSDNSGSTLMRCYRSGGTLWTVIIGRDGLVYFNDYHAPTGPICKLVDLLRTRA